MARKVTLKSKTPFGNAGEEVVISEEIFEAYGEDFFEKDWKADDSELDKTSDPKESEEKTDPNESDPEETTEEDEEKPGVLGKIFGNGKNKAILEPKSTK